MSYFDMLAEAHRYDAAEMRQEDMARHGEGGDAIGPNGEIIGPDGEVVEDGEDEEAG